MFDDIDSQLAAAARTDRGAFGDLYDRNADQLLAYFYRRVACPHTAADLAAETWADALHSIDRYDPTRGAARGWLYGIAANQMRRWLRSGQVSNRARRRLGVDDIHLDDDDVAHIESLVDLAPLRAELVGALAALSTPVRDAVVLRVVHDLSYDQIAMQLRCTPGAARVRVSRGLAQLHAAFDTPAVAT